MFALVHLHFIRRRRTYEHLGKRVKRKDVGMDKWVNVFGRFCIEACASYAVSADDTDLILQSDQSVARVNSRLAWSFEWAWMINAVSVGHRVSTYDIPV
tara:strand:+ start:138 stop:434 length:297 start_codon:yes stop_codon:yes gene_type:complete